MSNIQQTQFFITEWLNRIEISIVAVFLFLCVISGNSYTIMLYGISPLVLQYIHALTEESYLKRFMDTGEACKVTELAGKTLKFLRTANIFLLLLVLLKP